MQSSQPVDPVATLTDDDVVGEFRYRDAKPKRELVNTPRVRFIAPESIIDGDVVRFSDAETSWPSEAEIAALVEQDGEELAQTLRLGYVSTHQRAQRRLKAFVLETRLGLSITVATSLRMLGVVEGDVIRVALQTFPQVDRLYSVKSWELAGDFSTITFQLVEFDPTIARDWNPEEDEQPFVPVEEEA